VGRAARPRTDWLLSRTRAVLRSFSVPSHVYVRVCVWFWQGGDKIVLAASQCHDIEEQIKKTHAIPSIASSALSGKIYDAPGAAGGGEGSGGGGGGSARQKGAA
jgi:hypothetical protein